MIDVVVIGAGAAGLSAAYRLKTLGVQTLTLEAGDHPGGVVRSSVKDGFHVEFGPNSLMLTPYLSTLIDDLALEQDVIEAEPVYKYRYLVKDKKLHPLSPHPLKILTSSYLSLGAKARLFSERYRKSVPSGEESVADFCSRRFGREVTESLADPVMTGIYAGDIRQLSAAHTLPLLVAWERDYRSVTKGLMKNKSALSRGRKVVNIRGGVGQLMGALAAKLGPGLVTGARVTAVRSAEGGYAVEYNVRGKSKRTEARSIIYAAPAYGLPEFPFFEDVHAAARAIPYAPIRVLHLAVPAGRAALPPGFGFLVPSRENLALLGCIFSSSLFPSNSKPGYHLLTVMIGGAHRARELADNPGALQAQAVRELKEILHFDGDPVVLSGVTLERAIPQKNVGYEAAREAFRGFEVEHNGIFFAGNYLSGVSLPDTIEYGSKVAERVYTFLM